MLPKLRTTKNADGQPERVLPLWLRITGAVVVSLWSGLTMLGQLASLNADLPPFLAEWLPAWQNLGVAAPYILTLGGLAGAGILVLSLLDSLHRRRGTAAKINANLERIVEGQQTGAAAVSGLEQQVAALAGPVAAVQPLLGSLSDAQQAAARDARDQSSELKAVLAGVVPAIDGRLDGMAKQTAALEGVPASLAAIDGRLEGIAKETAEQLGTLKQELQTAISTAAERLAPPPTAEASAGGLREHILAVTPRTDFLSDSWQKEPRHTSADYLHAAQVGRCFVVLEIRNVGTTSLSTVIARCSYGAVEPFEGAWSQEAGSDFVGARGTRTVTLEVQNPRLLVVGEVFGDHQRVRSKDHVFIKLPTRLPFFSLDFDRVEADGAPLYLEKFTGANLTLGPAAELAVDFFASNVHEAFRYRLFFSDGAAQIEETSRRVIVSPADSPQRYSEGDAQLIARGLEAPERADAERERVAATVAMVAAYNRALPRLVQDDEDHRCRLHEPEDRVQQLKLAREAALKLWKDHATAEEREHGTPLHEAFSSLSTYEDPAFPRKRLHAGVLEIARRAGLESLVGDQPDEPSPPADNASVQALWSIYSPLGAAVNKALTFSTNQLHQLTDLDSPSEPKDRTLYNYFQSLFDAPCSLLYARLDKRMKRLGDKPTVRELHQSVLRVRELLAAYQQLLTEAVVVGRFIASGDRLRTDPFLREVANQNDRLLRALELAHSRKDGVEHAIDLRWVGAIESFQRLMRDGQ
jgi:hypothetical protein